MATTKFIHLARWNNFHKIFHVNLKVMSFFWLEGLGKEEVMRWMLECWHGCEVVFIVLSPKTTCVEYSYWLQQMLKIRITNSPLFHPKNFSCTLSLSDFCCNSLLFWLVCNRYVSRGIDEANRSKWDKWKGIVVSICVFPSINLVFLKKSFGLVSFRLHPLHKRCLIGDNGGLIGGFFFCWAL